MQLAIVTAASARDKDADTPWIAEALTARGITHAVLDWDDGAVDWSAYTTVAIRSTWDYIGRLDAFLAWAGRVAAATRLVNPVDVIRWNTHKGYLLDLAAKGLPIVPTRLIRVGEPMPTPDDDDVVVKPAVSAGSHGARRVVAEPAAAQAHGAALLAEGRDVVIQPYLRAVDRSGETSLIYFDGQFSHAIRKAALLAPNADPRRALFDSELIQPRTPQAAELALGEAVLRALPFGTLTYARVDLLLDADGAPCVLELELTEPSLFLATAPGAVDRYIDALLR
jgi:glutathione synthase/RimK-type ligase-like ATP-grasp enzyme